MRTKKFPNLRKFDLTDKVAIVTGAAGLLGFEHCSAILESGGSVALWDIDVVGLKKSKARLNKTYPKNQVITQVVDITIESQVKSAMNVIISSMGNPHILINNAAINPKFEGYEKQRNNSRIENLDIDYWNTHLNVGLTGAFICSKIIGTKMAELNSGIILNIASDLSIIAPDQRIYENELLSPNLQSVKPVTYSVIKNGLVGLTKYLAIYWRTNGIRVNALSPGGVEDGQSQEFIHRISQLIPVGRMANKEEFRSAIQFLCSDASSYMTGQNIVIDGGRTVW
jgi:NAD(P)-dependent dehydrogenase (short-subunit alcohol dehydrogenase family)